MDCLQSKQLSEFSISIDTRCVFDVCGVEKNLEHSVIGKTCGVHNIVKEFIMYSHLPVVMLLHFLFNVMVHHVFILDSFGNIVRIPAI